MSTISFPQLTDSEMRGMLAPPTGPVRLILDTDTANEIDDQFALAWALLSPDLLELEGITAEPFSFAHHQAPLLRAHELIHSNRPVPEAEQALVDQYAGWVAGLDEVGLPPQDIPFVGPAQGMELSYQEILLVYRKLNLNPDGLVFRGADRYMEAPNQPIVSASAEHIIECALRSDERPLYVSAIGCVTNIAAAILMEPEIIRRIVVLWTSGFPSGSHRPNTSSLNLVQDVHAARLLFDCGVPHVYLPGFHIGAQLRLSLPEMEAWVRGRGAIGDYLYHLYTHNPIYAQRGIQGHFGRSWVIWDIINIAWLLNPDWVPTDLLPSPLLNEDLTWTRSAGVRHLMREAYDINRDAIFRDFFHKLEKAS